MSGQQAPSGARYFRSLSGYMLVAGCERTMLAVVAGMGIGPIYIGGQGMLTGSFLVGALGLSLGAAVLFGGIYVLRRMAKRDPMMTRVYLRNRRLRPFYPAQSTPWCRR